MSVISDGSGGKSEGVAVSGGAGAWEGIPASAGRSGGVCGGVSLSAGRYGDGWGEASVNSDGSGGEVCTGTGCAGPPVASSVEPWAGSSWEGPLVFSGGSDPVEGDSTLGRPEYPAGRPAGLPDASGREASLLTALSCLSCSWWTKGSL